MSIVWPPRLTIATMVALIISTAIPASALEFDWTGVNYIPVPTRLGSDTRLVMPEECDDAWERESDVTVTPLDSRTLIIRPRQAQIEQRLTLRGRRSGTLYLARVSSAISYAPIITVRNLQMARDQAVGTAEAAIAGAGVDAVVALTRALLLSTPPPGYRVEASRRVLLERAPIQVTARSVWRSPKLAGVIADVKSSLGEHRVSLVPADLVIRIPDLGTLRAAALDRFEIDGSAPLRLVLVYSHP